MAIGPRDRPHFHVQGSGESEIYTSPRRGGGGLPPTRARAAHAAKLEQALELAVAEARRQLSARDPAVAEGEPGFYLDFEVPVDQQAALDGLENRPKKIELVAVHPPEEGDEAVRATVFVPASEAEFFTTKVQQYRDDDSAGGKPRNQSLVARIDDVRLADVRSLFTDADHLYPADARQAWWEVWLRDGRLPNFRAVAERLNVAVRPHLVRFPERDVVLALADAATMARLVANTDAVAELRAPKDSPSFFLEMRSVEQAKWAGDLVKRVTTAGTHAPVVCLLDSGATLGHPLIARGLEPDDQHAYDDALGRQR